MSNATPLKRLIPQADGKALDAIKICAAIFMVIGQAGLSWRGPPDGNHGGFTATFSLAAFVLFCYAQAIAMLRHEPLKAPRYSVMKYGMRIAVLAVVVEPISLFSRDITVPNALFALVLGAIFSGYCRKLKPLECYVLAGFLLLAATAKPPFEMGLAGVVLPAMLVLGVTGQRLALGFAAVAVAMIALQGGLLDTTVAVTAYKGALVQAGCALAAALVVLQLSVFVTQTGRLLPKYALYAFYPVQMLALWALFKL